MIRILGPILAGPLLNFAESFIDNVVRGKVTPIRGSIIKCDLYTFQHTGIYLGGNRIVELCGNGSIRETDPRGFRASTNAISVYVACNGMTPLGSEEVARRAESYVGTSRDYHILVDNCHKFVIDCILNGQEPISLIDTSFIAVEEHIKMLMNHGNPIDWRVWGDAAPFGYSSLKLKRKS